MRYLLLLMFLGVCYSPVVWAVNWLSVLATEDWVPSQFYTLQGKNPLAATIGFAQAEYLYTKDQKLTLGPWGGQSALFNQVRGGSEASRAENLNIIRARLGLRGRFLSLNSKINYLFLTEWGNNPLTNQDEYRIQVTQASITFNHIPGMRIQLGRLRQPLGEEAFQAIREYKYINLSSPVEQLLLERHFLGDGSNPRDPNFIRGFSAFQDIGIQLFDIFTHNHWEYSYAIMIGQGSPLNHGDNNDNKDGYFYLSAERLFGGLGLFRQGWKFFTWGQYGERTLEQSGAGDYDRLRYGVGSLYQHKKWRTGFEYIQAKGMIFAGTDSGALPGAVSNNNRIIASFNVLTKEEAQGWVLDASYLIMPKWEVSLRYDELHNATKQSTNERRFQNFTLGTRYFFTHKVHLLFNYTIRDIEAPHLPKQHPANQILDKTDDQLGLQLLVIL